jgi:tRNA-dihydrouridine synthase B
MMLKPFQIGSVEIKNPVMLAPMAGLADSAFRTLCMRFGCGLTFTEITNAAALVRKSWRTWLLLATTDEERPVVAHIYGRDPQEMAKAARRIEEMGYFSLIDINCGCPVRRIMVRGCGAALMGEPALIGRIVESISAAVSLPVTVKTRIGLDPDHHNIDEIARVVEESGGSAIAIHARYASAGHGGPADWEALASVKQQRGIAVIGNGGITVPGDVAKMFSKTGVDGVMIGRAALGCPWIFRQIADLAAGGTGEWSPSDTELLDVIRAHTTLLFEMKEREAPFRRRIKFPPEASAALTMRPHLLKYLNGRTGIGEVRKRLNDLDSVESVCALAETVL